MGIQTFAVVQQSNAIKISKDKNVTLNLGQKGDQSLKFSGAYSSSDVATLYGSQVQQSAVNVLSGLNSSLVVLSTSFSGDGDVVGLGDSTILSRAVKDIFSLIEKHANQAEYLVSASMFQISGDGSFTDLINPHGRNILFKKHSKHGSFAEGLSQLVCSNADDVLKLYEDGLQVQNALKLSPFVVSFNLKVLQRPAGTSTSTSSSASFKFIAVNSEKSNMAKLLPVLSEIAQKKEKLLKSAQQHSSLFEFFLDLLMGNSNVCLLADVDDKDLETTSNLLSAVESLTGSGLSAKPNREDNEMIAHQIRNEIAKIRSRLVGQQPPNKNDLSLMEKLMEDLDETKRNGWDAILLRSDHFYEERRTSFTNKGLIWILESAQKANRENVKLLQNTKEKLTAEYKNQRQITERLNTELKQKIDVYTQLINSGKPDDNTKKSHVAAISELKERHKRENETLKDIKNKLKETQAKLQGERQSGVEESSSSFDVAYRAMVEEQEKTRRENEQLVEEELEKMKIEIEQEKADLQLKFTSKSLIKSDDEVLRHRVELAQLRSEKSVITTQLDAMRKERVQMEEHMRILSEKHSRELEIQQLQNLQTFRAYREVFEEYKVELENRWRSLLDDAVQDAVFLNARNNELSEEVAKLNLEVARYKDDRSIGKAKV